MEETLKNAYVEVDIILDKLGSKYKRKVPYELRKLFKERQNKNYEIGKELRIEEISRTALIIISILNLKYWEKDPEKIKMLEKIYSNNQKEYIEKINVYQQKDWLKNRRVKSNEVEEKSLQKEKKSIIQRIRKFFRELFFEQK